MRKIKAMHNEYGELFNSCMRLYYCGNCCNLIKRKQNKVWYKCIAYGDSKSESTDWAKSYEACRLYNVPFKELGHLPLIEKLKHMPKGVIDEPIEGQIDFEQVKGEL